MIRLSQIPVAATARCDGLGGYCTQAPKMRVYGLTPGGLLALLLCDSCFGGDSPADLARHRLVVTPVHFGGPATGGMIKR